MNGLKLNLGCGEKRLPGYINVDKYGSPDIKHDLESFPWPWETNSVSNILLIHVLEHLGKDVETYFGIFKEMYRKPVFQHPELGPILKSKWAWPDFQAMLRFCVGDTPLEQSRHDLGLRYSVTHRDQLGS